MFTFIGSIALVAVAQIPLLLKLWLDYKGRTSTYKLELYRRQLEAFRALSTLASEVHTNVDTLMMLSAEGSLGKPNEDATIKELTVGFYKDWSEFHKQFREAEFFLPAETISSLSRFSTCAVRIMTKTTGMPAHANVRAMRLSDLWREQNEHFISLLNQMRMVCGIDALSSEVFKEFNAGTNPKLLGYTYEEYTVDERILE
ncbi:MAG TPA: hypothetical protein VNP98_01145 [Chthoniobacterales bacterium]|nr:hypothetical protein [Chthoniobacterales bacterium]